MLSKRLSLTLVGAASFGIGANAFSQETVGEGLKVGFQYNAGLVYDNHALEDTELRDKDPSSTTTLSEGAVAKVTAHGTAAKDVDFALQYNLLHTTNIGVEKAYVLWKHSDLMSLTIGRAKANQGAWEIKNSGYADVAPLNPYAHALPFAKWSDQVAVHLNLAGTLTFQFVNDPVAAPTDANTATRKNHKHKNPAFNVEWVGDFNGWKPLVQLGSYDLNKSNYLSLGVMGQAAGLGVTADLTSDQRKWFAGSEDASDTLMSYNLTLDYAVGGFTPWIKYSAFDHKQGDNDTTGREDDKGNISPDSKADATTGAVAFDADNAFQDNGTAYTIGANCNHFGKGYEPYVAIVMQQGSFDSSKTAGEEEDLSNMMVKVGVLGAF